MSWSRLDLGVGIIVAPGLDLLWDRISDLIDVLEVEPQTMWRPRLEGGWDLVGPAFQWVSDRAIPTLAHGVGFPVGGCEPPDPAGVALAAESAARLGAAHWSEHLSYNRVQIGGKGIDAGFLLPPAQTQAGAESAAEHAAAYQAAAALPFLVETGTNYLQPRPGELRDGAFIAAVAQRADCGILLDLHNLLANQRNGRQPVAGVLAELPLERVLEVHLAGGFELDGYYLDAHVGGPDSELIALAAEVLPRLPNLRALLFEAMPQSLAALGVPGVRAVLTAMHQLWDGRGTELAGRFAQSGESAGQFGRDGESAGQFGRDGEPAGQFGRDGELAGRLARDGELAGLLGPAAQLASAAGPAPAAEPTATADWERNLAAYTSRACDQPPADDPGICLLRRLADQARLGELTLAQPGLLRSLIARLGTEETEALLLRYLQARPPQRWTAREGAQFASWLAGQPA
jgi:uncharacterized protein (UPF0276 family)